MKSASIARTNFSGSFDLNQRDLPCVTVFCGVFDLAPLIGTSLNEAIGLTSGTARAAEPKTSDAVWYERIEAGCKAEAKRYYAAVHFKKRRLFIKHCIDRAYH